MTLHRNYQPSRVRSLAYSTRRRGTVLLTVTVVVMLISLAAFGFATRMQTEHKAALATADQLQARAAARSGVALVAAVLEQPRQFRDAFGGLLNNPQQFRGHRIAGTDRDDRPGRFSIVARPQDGTTRASQDTATSIRFGVDDESTRLHLPTLLKWDREYPGAGRDALMHLPGMTTQLADHLLDWLDADSQPRQFGAEFYSDGGDSPSDRLDAPPHNPGNRIPACLEELLDIPGVTSTDLFGVDHNRNYRDDDLPSMGTTLRTHPGGAPSDSGPPWADYLTLHSGERNQSADGQPRIFVNQSDLGRLHRQLVEALDPELANFTVAVRQFGPTSSGSSAAPASSFSLDLSIPASHNIESLLDLIDTAVEIPTGDNEKARTFSSPLHSGSGDLHARVTQFLDHCTISPETTLTGRINVTTAPREVLLGIPDLDAALVDRILTARGVDEETTTARTSAVWLWTAGIVNLQQMKRLLPRLTTGGDVVRFQAIGFFDADSPTCRMEIILDASQTPAQIVRQVDLQRRGRGFDLRALGWEPPFDDRALQRGTGTRPSSARKDS